MGKIDVKRGEPKLGTGDEDVEKTRPVGIIYSAV